MIRQLALFSISLLLFSACGSGIGLDKTELCFGSAPISSSGSEFVLIHSVYTFDDDSVMVECEVRSDAAGYASSRLFRASQQGVLTSPCQVVFDVDAPSSGIWRFNKLRTEMKSTVTYEDPNSTHNGRTFDAMCEEH